MFSNPYSSILKMFDVLTDLSKALVCMESGFIKVHHMREKTIERMRTIALEAQG